MGPNRKGAIIALALIVCIWTPQAWGWIAGYAIGEPLRPTEALRFRIYASQIASAVLYVLAMVFLWRTHRYER